MPVLREHRETTMQFILTVVFACGVGCGAPPSVHVDSTYPTHEACDTAGKAWLSSNANPERAVRSYTCTHSTR